MTLPSSARYLGHAPSPATLAKGLRDGEAAVRWPLGSCEIWAIPAGSGLDLAHADGADFTPKAVQVDQMPAAEPQTVHPFGIPADLQDRFREIIQDWRGAQIVEAFEEKGGKWRRELNTGQMARVILGLDKAEVLNEDARTDLRGAKDVGDLSDLQSEGRGAMRSESGAASGSDSNRSAGARRRTSGQDREGPQKSEAGPGGLMVQGLLFE